jgi:dTDP-4-amino-4,6-dideoxygalactose transaminase
MGTKNQRTTMTKLLDIPFTGLKKQYKNLSAEILDATDIVLRSGQLMNGPYTEQFESWLARYSHSTHAVTVHSGTAALEAIAEYYHNEFQEQPRVIIPSMTYRATANAFIRAGWQVEFVDTDAYGILDFDQLPVRRYQAVVIVGLYGASVAHAGSVRQWQDWLAQDVLIFEDGAQHWLADNGTRIGIATAVSFDPTKNLPCYGNGGAVVTRNSNLANFVRKWRSNGNTTGDLVGTNSRMSEIDCGVLLIKANYLHDWQVRRQEIAQYYIDQFRDMPIRCLVTDGMMHSHAFHKFVIDIDERDRVQADLTRHGIETKIHYAAPLHEESAYSHIPGPGLLSCASALSRRVLSLPIYPELTDAEVEYVARQVRVHCYA